MIPYTVGDWYGYEKRDFTFDGKPAVLVCPHMPVAGDKWLFKTEYFGAFPELELSMLARGYHIAHVDNQTRWCLPTDTERQAAFADYLHRECGLNEKCVPVGMSCGGMMAVYLGAKHPEKVAAMWIDAPVIDLLSCPGQTGKSQVEHMTEYTRDTGKTLADLFNDNEFPLDYLPALVEHRIPVMLTCGDSDREVPYEENGKQMTDFFAAHGGTLELILKKGGDHHPHGLTDNTPIIRFIERYY